MERHKTPDRRLKADSFRGLRAEDVGTLLSLTRKVVGVFIFVYVGFSD
jgi:hypothetical protein